MSKYSIENELLKIEVKAQGAELCSILKKSNQKEYVWQANADFWGRHAPILFPFVGRLKDDTYHHNGMSYNVGQHGFARDKNFTVTAESEDSLTFELTSDETTTAIYPFQFKVVVTYRLEEDTVITRYEVLNLDEGDMYFSIGGHPAFNCPMNDSLNREDYLLEFDKSESLPAYRLEDGNFNGETAEVFTEAGKIVLSKNLFDHDALVFKDFKSEAVSLKDIATGIPVLTFHFKGFPYLGIWSKNSESPFVCIEPWYGLADNADHDGDIKYKEGIQKLEAEDTFSCEYGVEIH